MVDGVHHPLLLLRDLGGLIHRLPVGCLLDKIRGTGRGGISADDPEAVQKLKSKLAGLEQEQERMKAVNAYYRNTHRKPPCRMAEQVSRSGFSWKNTWSRFACRSISVQGPAQESGRGWGIYIIADLKTWADNAENRSPLEHFPSFETAKARFDELRTDGGIIPQPFCPGEIGDKVVLPLAHMEDVGGARAVR